MGQTDRPVTSVILYKEDGTPVVVDAKGLLGIADAGNLVARNIVTGAAGTVAAYASVTGASISVVRATAYTEPASASQMELLSNNANDDGSPGGTGTRTVRVTYYDGNLAGPFTEDVTLNGTAAVATVATNIRFVESIKSLTVGSNGTNLGTITLRLVGGGATVGTIAASDGRTYWGHHYVGVGRVCKITELTAAMSLVNGTVFLRSNEPLTANGFEEQITASQRLGSGVALSAGHSSLQYQFGNLYVTGPARVTAYVDPDAATANNVAHVSFGFVDV